jgi:hypothetical protein
MKYVFVKHKYPHPVSFGKYGTIPPDTAVEVSEFDYKGSLENEAFWELVTPPVEETPAVEGSPPEEEKTEEPKSTNKKSKSKE